MTDTTTLAPTDAELMQVIKGAAKNSAITRDGSTSLRIARAVLAKWGAPVAVPAAWAATSEEGNVEALGMNQSRRFDTPLYAAPQPPAQAAHVDVAKDLHDEILRLPCAKKPEWYGGEQHAYKLGHRDARYAAAELAAARAAQKGNHD